MMMLLRVMCVLFISAGLFSFAVTDIEVGAQTVERGPRIGERIPTPIALTDESGAVKSFTNIAGTKGVVIAFVRSATWCPYCQLQLKDFQSISDNLIQMGYPLVAISYDKPSVLSRFAQQHGLTYALMSDQGSKTIDAFGIRDPQYAPGSFAFGVPYPIIYVVDRNGVVQAKLSEEGYKKRPAIDDIVAAVKGVN